jgi:hypothetical protein
VRLGARSRSLLLLAIKLGDEVITLFRGVNDQARAQQALARWSLNRSGMRAPGDNEGFRGRHPAIHVVAFEACDEPHGKLHSEASGHRPAAAGIELDGEGCGG